jgi:tetratricopeptide (TPR) repeat protein
MATIARLVTVMEAQMKGWEQAQTSFERTARSMDAGVAKIDSTMKSLGGAARTVAGAFGLAFSTGQIIAFGKEIGEFSGKMLDLRDQTRISTDALQAFNIAGSDVGLTIDDIVNAADQLAKRVGGGDDSAERALQKLGISAYQFKQLKLDEAIFLIDKRLVGVANQYDQASIKSDLFGRAGQRMGRMMNGSLEETINKIKQTGGIIEEELLVKADKFDQFWKEAWIKFRAYAVGAVASVSSYMASTPIPRMIAFLDKGFSGIDLPSVPNRPVNMGAPSGAPMFPTAEEMKRVADSAEKAAKRNQEAADSARRLDDAYKAMKASVIEADSAFNNSRGVEQMNADLALLNATTSQATKNLQALTMMAERVNAALPSSGYDTAALMHGPGAMPFGGNLFGTNSGGTPMAGGGTGGGSFFGNIFGGLKDSFAKMWEGMSGGKGIGGLLAGMGSGFLTGGLSSLLGMGISGIGKLFGGLFGGEGKKTNDVRDSAFASMGGFENVARIAQEAGFAMDRLLKPSKVKDFQRAWEDFNKTLERHQQHLGSIAQLQDLQAQRQNMLNEAVQRYGFTLEELPEQMRAQEMAQQAEQLLTDFQLLMEAGFNIDKVIERMGDSINAFIQDAIKTGTEVPNKMRGMLEKMLEQGRLTDEAGNKLEDLSAINFGDSLELQFENVLLHIDEMIAKLTEMINLIRNVPQIPNQGFVTPSGPEPPPEFPAGPDIPGFTFGTRGRFIDFGAGTPVMLHGRERVMTEGESLGGNAVVAAIDRLGARLQREVERAGLAARDATLKAMA